MQTGLTSGSYSLMFQNALLSFLAMTTLITPIQLNGEELSNSLNEKDLGVILSSNLKPTQQVATAVNIVIVITFYSPSCLG